MIIDKWSCSWIAWNKKYKNLILLYWKWFEIKTTKYDWMVNREVILSNN